MVKDDIARIANALEKIERILQNLYNVRYDASEVSRLTEKVEDLENELKYVYKSRLEKHEELVATQAKLDDLKRDLKNK